MKTRANINVYISAYVWNYNQTKTFYLFGNETKMVYPHFINHVSRISLPSCENWFLANIYSKVDTRENWRKYCIWCYV